jgi:hypothetical protein
LTFTVDTGPQTILLFAPLQAAVIVVVAALYPACIRAMRVAIHLAFVHTTALAMIVHALRAFLASATASRTAVVAAFAVSTVGHAETLAGLAVAKTGARPGFAPFQTAVTVILSALLNTVGCASGAARRLTLFFAGANAEPIFTVHATGADSAGTATAVATTLFVLAIGLAPAILRADRGFSILATTIRRHLGVTRKQGIPRANNLGL